MFKNLEQCLSITMIYGENMGFGVSFSNCKMGRQLLN